MTTDQDRQEAERALANISCPYCGSIVTVQQVLHPGHCGSQPCVTAHIVKGAKARDEQRQQEYAERQEDARLHASAKLVQAANAHGCDANDLLVAVVPYQDEPVEPLSDEGRAKFQSHIERIVDEAFHAVPDAISLLNYTHGPNEEPPIVAAGCTACQGFCCKRGGGDNHAFLTRQTVYYMRKNDPALEPEEVIAHYLDAVPDASVHGACVYQSAQGCTLDRKWRAGLCNSFHCHDLHALHDLTGGRMDVPLAVVGINDDQPGKVVAYSAASGVIELEVI
jgi:hypothetical protein